MMRLKGVTDVFFDLDHTLWDFDKNSALTFEKIFVFNNIDVDLDVFLSHYESINLEYWKLYREEKIDKTSLRYNRLNDAFKAIGYKASREIINTLSVDYINHLTSFNHLFEDVVLILDYLYKDYELHIITNGFEEVQQEKLNKSKIAHYFKTVTHSETVGVKKPNPKIFNHALQLANTLASKSVMIGDNYEADIIGAKDVGMEAIHFNIHNKGQANGISQISALRDLKQFL